MGLNVLGATWGPADVTTEVQAKVVNNALNISSRDLGVADPWPNILKTLVVVFQYDGYGPQFKLTDDRSSLSITTADAGPPVPSPTPYPTNQITVLAAVFGKADVSHKVVTLINTNNAVVLSAIADDATWGDGWVGQKKTFVLVFAVGPLIRTLVVEEGQPMRASAAYLNIIGAYWYNEDVTGLMRGLVRNNCLMVSTPLKGQGDPAPNTVKPLVIYYRYNGEALQSAITWDSQGVPIDISYVQKPQAPVITDPSQLVISAAYYGRQSVLTNIQNLVVGNALSFTPDQVLADTWPGTLKVFSISYRYGGNPVQTEVYTQHALVSISQPQITSTTLSSYNVGNLVEDGDRVNFAASNHLFLAVDATQRVVASAPDLDAGGTLEIVRTATGLLLLKDVSSGNYVRTAASGNGTLYATATTASDATAFAFSLLQNGDVVIAASIAGGAKYLELQADTSVTATGVSPFGLQSGFSIAFNFQPPAPTPPPPPSPDTCEAELITLILQLTVSFLLTIGLSLNIAEGQVEPGIVGLIKSSPEAMAAIENVVTSTAVQRITPRIAVGVLVALYEANLLWKLLRLLLQTAGWFLLGRVFAKLVEFILAPEIEAIELTAGFLVWSLQTTEAAVAYGRCKASSAA